MVTYLQLTHHLQQLPKPKRQEEKALSGDALPAEAVWACRGSQASGCPRQGPAPHAITVLLPDTMSPPVWSISRAVDVTVAEDHPTCFLWGEPKAKASLDHRRTSEKVKRCKSRTDCREDMKVLRVRTLPADLVGPGTVQQASQAS